ncbi:MAG: hypothetical protein HY774_14745 [Acidobacteria bacterium]|nr:hypothetical protein [Acidobacteriota bacterium]
MSTLGGKRTHIVIPEELALQIDEVVGKRGRTRFISEAVQQQLTRLRQLQALREASGAWKDADHPELAEGSAAWVRSMRDADERQFQELMQTQDN